MKIKTGLIGISGYGSVHLQHLSKLAEEGLVEISAAVVINPDQVADDLAKLKASGTQIYSSADAMFQATAGQLDLVCIPTGIAFHEPMTVQALQNGANVLVEKPAASSNAAVARMKKAEQDSGKFAAVGFQHIYAREIQFIKNYLLSGEAGKIKQVFGTGIWPRADQYYARNGWAGKLAAADGTPILDSPINNAFAHYLNLELFLAGSSFAASAHAVDVQGTLYRARKEIETFDSCALRFSTEAGIPLSILLSHTWNNNINPVIRIECENGAVTWRLGKTWDIRSAGGEIIHSGAVEAPHDDMFMDVIRKVSGESVFCCSLDIAAEHTNCIEMLTKKLTPVEPVESVSRQADDGQYILADTESVFAECMEKSCLPSELTGRSFGK